MKKTEASLVQTSKTVTSLENKSAAQQSERMKIERESQQHQGVSDVQFQKLEGVVEKYKKEVESMCSTFISSYYFIIAELFPNLCMGLTCTSPTSVPVTVMVYCTRL